jgi:DNA-nicking Smr family endonuclease
MSRPKPPADPVPEAARERQPGRRRGRTLAAEEARLWAEVTKSLTPLRRPKRTQPGTPELSSAAAASDAAVPAAKAGDGAAARTPAPRHGKGSHDTLPVKRRIPDLAGFTRRDLRQLTTGRQSIEARLDLHGLRQAEAHTALRGFLAQCQDQGLKHVLVITGKGGEYNREEALFGEREPGVLKRLAPFWLAEPGLRGIVAGFTEAPLRHGGAGALYVRLRSRRGADG